MPPRSVVVDHDFGGVASRRAVRGRGLREQPVDRDLDVAARALQRDRRELAREAHAHHGRERVVRDGRGRAERAEVQRDVVVVVALLLREPVVLLELVVLVLVAALVVVVRLRGRRLAQRAAPCLLYTSPSPRD